MSLIRWLGEVEAIVTATTERFVAREKFSDSSGIKFYIWNSFQNWFLNKIEEPFAGSVLRYGKLQRASLDIPIVSELGKKAETSLTEMFALIARQPKGESDILLTNGRANIFYIPDVNDILRAVFARWAGGGWLLLASPLEYPLEWNAGDQVFSRKF